MPQRSLALAMPAVLIAFLAIVAAVFVWQRAGGNGTQIRLTLHPLEQMATRKGPTIRVTVDGRQSGNLSAEKPELHVHASAPASAEFVYIGGNGEPTDVSWTQTVEAGGSLVVIQPWRDPEPERNLDWQALAWARSSDRQVVLNHVENPSGMTVVAPIWWTIGRDGKLTTEADPELLAQLQGSGIAVWLTVQGLNADGLHAALAEEPARLRLAEQLSREAQGVGANGINIDLEGFRTEDAASLTSFVETLAKLVRLWGGVSSFDMVARSDFWEVSPEHLSYWSNAPQRRQIAAAVDYTILMAYDQYNDHRPAGPVAALNWVEEVLIYQLRYSDPKDVLLGIPAYGREWSPDAAVKSRARSLSAFHAGSLAREFDRRHCLERVVRADGRYFWAENAIASARIGLARDYGLGGIAIWRLGLDTPELWQAVRETRPAGLFGKLTEALGWLPRPESAAAILARCAEHAR